MKQAAPGSKEPHTSWTTDGSPFWSVDVHKVMQGSGAPESLPAGQAASPAAAATADDAPGPSQQMADRENEGARHAGQRDELESLGRTELAQGRAPSSGVLHPLQSELSCRTDCNV